MATKTATKSTPVKAAAPKVAETTPAVDFDTLPEATIVTYVRTSTRTAIDREESTPKVIKARVNAGYTATVAKGKVNAKGKLVPVQFTQACGSAAHAEAFLKLGKLYASFINLTMRGKVVSDSDLNTLIQKGDVPAGTKSGTVVSFSVNERETRVRKS